MNGPRQEGKSLICMYIDQRLPMGEVLNSSYSAKRFNSLHIRSSRSHESTQSTDHARVAVRLSKTSLGRLTRGIPPGWRALRLHPETVLSWERVAGRVEPERLLRNIG